MVLYALIKKLPINYENVVEELKEVGFSISEVLEGMYDSRTLFENSKALREIAVNRIIDELVTEALDKPNGYTDGFGKFGYTIDINDFVDDFLDDLRKYYTKIEE